jgi:hypothetical protein
MKAPFLAFDQFLAGSFDLFGPDAEGGADVAEFSTRVASHFILSNISTPSLQMMCANRSTLSGYVRKLRGRRSSATISCSDWFSPAPRPRAQ